MNGDHQNENASDNDDQEDEQSRHKQLLAQVVTGESRISMEDYSVVRERILEHE